MLAINSSRAIFLKYAIQEMGFPVKWQTEFHSACLVCYVLKVEDYMMNDDSLLFT